VKKEYETDCFYLAKNEGNKMEGKEIENTTLSNIFFANCMLYNYLLKTMCWTIDFQTVLHVNVYLWIVQIFILNAWYIL
jgi:hypothetical protein